MAVAGISGKDRFTALDTIAASRELRALVGSHLDKAFDLEPRGISLALRGPSEGKREIVVVPGRYVAVLARSERHAETLGAFAKDLRRLLTGSRLIEVPDPRGERYVELVFHRGDSPGDLTVGIELFGDGNIVVARDGRLVSVQRTRRWAHREVRIGAEYSRPPSRGDPFARTSPDLAVALGQSRTDRASTLAARLGFGGPVAEELLARAGVDGARPATESTETVAESIVRSVGSVLEELGDRPSGFLYLADGEPVDVAPVPLRRWADRPELTVERIERFSDAAERYFEAMPEPQTIAPDPSAVARAELERLRERQESAIANLTEEIGELKRSGEAVLVDLPAADQALANLGPDDPDEVTIELGGRSVSLRRGRPARAQAAELFDAAKRLGSKLAGAEEALDATVGKLAAIERTPPPVTSTPGPSGKRATKVRWFERYRWFLSSEGILIVGGRDASSNDLLVRRYLKPGDLYVHAEIHGAPSVLVKHPAPGAPGATETTLGEAGQWGVAFSKAWRAGLASARAFWATPDQLSKSGASGEFVAKGAWVVHGTKHPLGDLATELAIGEIDLEGEPRWSVAPPRAIEARGTIRAYLTPGDERDRGPREIELARELGLARDRLQALLPAGGITVRRA